NVNSAWYPPAFLLIFRGLFRPENAKKLGDERFEIFAVNDGVDHAVLDKKLGALKSLRQLLPDRLLDHSRSGETDQRTRFGDIQITEHGETCSDATRCWIG